MDSKSILYEIIPAFEDNYVFLLHSLESKESLVIDPGEAGATLRYLNTHHLKLKAILLTHHHADHIGGAKELKKKFPEALIYAPLKNKHQIPFADIYVSDADYLEHLGLKFSVMELPGHTLGHIAYWSGDRKWLFSGDILFGLGCGRLFEGTPTQMFHSLQRIKSLPPESLIFAAHEYTETNLQFCKMLGPNDGSPIVGGDEALELYENELVSKRKLKLPSVPLKLYIEERVNPFLLAENAEQFTEIRELRNRF